MKGHAPRFLPRTFPLEPIAVAIPRVRAARAGRLLLPRPGDASGREDLRALVSSAHLLLFGPADALPWVDGAHYLGQDPQAPRLLVPTALVPDVPYALLERALFARAQTARAPAALLLDPLRLVDAASPGPFDAAAFSTWLEETSA